MAGGTAKAVRTGAVFLGTARETALMPAITKTVRTEAVLGAVRMEDVVTIRIKSMMAGTGVPKGRTARGAGMVPAVGATFLSRRLQKMTGS